MLFCSENLGVDQLILNIRPLPVHLQDYALYCTGSILYSVCCIYDQITFLTVLTFFGVGLNRSDAARAPFYPSLWEF